MNVSSLTLGEYFSQFDINVSYIDLILFSNIYTRRVLAGEFQVVCPWLLRDLVDRELWDDEMKNRIIANNGSVQNIPQIPDDIKAIYKTVWEISQKKVLDLAADRGAFICQSQSLNVHLQSPTIGQLTSMHFYGWKKGLKTGMYYLRTRPAAQAIQFTVDQEMLKKSQAVKKEDTPVVQPTRTVAKPSAPSASPSIPSLAPSTSGTSLASSGLPTPPPSSIDLSLDEKTRKAAEADPEFAAALQRQRDKELEQAKLMCSLENKEACVMCSG